MTEELFYADCFIFSRSVQNKPDHYSSELVKLAEQPDSPIDVGSSIAEVLLSFILELCKDIKHNDDRFVILLILIVFDDFLNTYGKFVPGSQELEKIDRLGRPPKFTENDIKRVLIQDCMIEFLEFYDFFTIFLELSINLSQVEAFIFLFQHWLEINALENFEIKKAGEIYLYKQVK